MSLIVLKKPTPRLIELLNQGFPPNNSYQKISFQTKDTLRGKGSHGGNLIEQTMDFILRNAESPESKRNVRYEWLDDYSSPHTKERVPMPSVTVHGRDNKSIRLIFPKDGVTGKHSGDGFMLNYRFGEHGGQYHLLNPRNNHSLQPMGQLSELNLSMKRSDTGYEMKETSKLEPIPGTSTKHAWGTQYHTRYYNAPDISRPGVHAHYQGFGSRENYPERDLTESFPENIPSFLVARPQAERIFTKAQWAKHLFDARANSWQ